LLVTKVKRVKKLQGGNRRISASGPASGSASGPASGSASCPASGAEPTARSDGHTALKESPTARRERPTTRRETGLQRTTWLKRNGGAAGASTRLRCATAPVFARLRRDRRQASRRRKGSQPLVTPLTLSTLQRFNAPMTLPGAALPGFCVLRSASMKMNWFGGAAQSNGVP
jgi:hypothetical protein